LLRCTSFRCVWLRQTVAALPRPDQSLHSACRRRWWIKSKIKSTRACAHCWVVKSGCLAWDLWRGCPSSERRPPSPLPRERGPIDELFKSRVRLGIPDRRTFPKQLGQSPLPPGEGQGEGAFCCCLKMRNCQACRTFC